MIITYSPEFWRRAYQLHDKRPRVCSQCSRHHQTAVPEPVIVRVVCLKPDEPTPESLDLQCTTCCRGPLTRAVPKKLILAKIGYLFPEMQTKRPDKHA